MICSPSSVAVCSWFVQWPSTKSPGRTELFHKYATPRRHTEINWNGRFVGVGKIILKNKFRRCMRYCMRSRLDRLEDHFILRLQKHDIFQMFLKESKNSHHTTLWKIGSWQWVPCAVRTAEYARCGIASSRPLGLLCRLLLPRSDWMILIFTLHYKDKLSVHCKIYQEKSDKSVKLIRLSFSSYTP